MAVKDQNHWVLDKRVNITMVLVVLVQTAAWVWWVSKLDSRVSNMEVWQTKYDNVGERLTRIEERQGYTIEILKKMEQRR